MDEDRLQIITAIFCLTHFTTYLPLVFLPYAKNAKPLKAAGISKFMQAECPVVRTRARSIRVFTPTAHIVRWMDCCSIDIPAGHCCFGSKVKRTPFHNAG
jgi:hypothetical protein